MPSIKGFSLNGNNYNLTIDSLGDLSKYNAETITESDNLSNLLANFFPGIDPSNVLSSVNNTSANTWTATEDCIVIIAARGSGYPNRVKINNVSVEKFSISEPQIYSFPLKKGQKLYIASDSYATGYVAYGLKYQ